VTAWWSADQRSALRSAGVELGEALPGVEHVHAAAPAAVPAARRLAADRNVTWSVGLGGLEPLRDETGNHLPAIGTEAAFVVCASSFLRAQVLRSTPYERWPRVAVAPATVTPATVTPATVTPAEPAATAVGAAAPESRAGRRVVLAAVAPDDPLGLGTLGAALRRLAQLPELAVEVHLVAPAADLARLRATFPDVAGRVRPAGATDVPAALVRRADACCLCTPAPPGALAVAALAAGVPVVAPDAGGMAELLDDGRAGALVPAGRDDRVAEELAAVLRHPDVAGRLAAAGRRRLATWPSPVDTAATVVALLDRHAGGARRVLLVPEGAACRRSA
jgi:hypothetical protein